MMETRTKTTERLVYRKGIRFNMIFNYFTYYFVGLVLFAALERENGSFFEWFSDATILMDMLILTSVTLVANFVYENIVINTTFIDIENNTLYAFIGSLVSTTAGVFIGSMWITNTELTIPLYSVLFIAFATVLNSQLSVGLFGVSALAATLVVHMLADLHKLGLDFKQDYVTLYFVTLSIFVLYVIMQWPLKMWFKRKLRVDMLKPKMASQFIVYTILFMSMLFISYFTVILVSSYFGWVTILSFKELILLFIGYLFLIFHYNFSLQRVSTKKVTNTIRETRRYI